MKTSNLIKTAITVVVVEAALCVIAAGTVQAEQCQLIPKSDSTSIESFEPGQLLDSGKFPQVDAALQKLYQKGISSEGNDLLTLRVVNDILIGKEQNLIRMWVDQYPKSFFAQFSAGVFYVNQAALARGSNTISKTSKNQLTNMSDLDKKAANYLQKAMQLDPRSALPQSVMLIIAAHEGQAVGKNTEQWLQSANQVNPKNLAARVQAITFLSPRWGGSFDQLNQIVQQAKKTLSSQEIRYLEYNVILAQANHEEVINKNKSAAYALYQRAKGMCENSQTAQDGMVRTYQ
ncbi:MAG: DUF4034 domain-containing protein [Burkholderiaceae bacterium]|jgi:hypothetical protein|nr:DUF4034 domain-containing protein [Burkholderiaceae bacterium]